MFRIVCDPSSGSIKLYLTEIRSGSLMFVVCLIGFLQRNFEPVVCVWTVRRSENPKLILPVLTLCLIIQRARNVSTIKLLFGYNLATCSGMMCHFQSNVLFRFYCSCNATSVPVSSCGTVNLIWYPPNTNSKNNECHSLTSC